MKSQNNTDQQVTFETSTHRQLARRTRLISKLMRLNLDKVMRDNPAVTRGEMKAASRSLDDLITAAVSSEDLATTLKTLDTIAEALGGRDALPFFSASNRRDRHSRRGRRHGCNGRHSRHEHGDDRHGHDHHNHDHRGSDRHARDHIGRDHFGCDRHGRDRFGRHN